MRVYLRPCEFTRSWEADVETDDDDGGHGGGEEGQVKVGMDIKAVHLRGVV